MSSKIHIADQFVWVSNHQLGALVAFALEVASSRASTDEVRATVANLRKFEASMWPGVDFDLAAQFPTVDEKKFWAAVFLDVARRVFLRELGRHDVSSWQARTIGDAYIIGRMLVRTVQEVELAWHPATEDAAEMKSSSANIKVTF